MSVRTIGRYEIIKELGQGGMGTVYLGFDPHLERKVAIKVLTTQLAHDAEFFERFMQEAKTLATLQHNAIVSLYDSGEDKGFPFFVMQLMTGGSLKERIAEKSLGYEEVMHIVGRVAAALSKAHALGIIHRDVKPANILFDDEGEAYLSDFGVVKLTQTKRGGLTQTGRSIGTPHYMSPEQLGGIEDVDGRTDIYALTVVLHEMLAGEPPYNHPSHSHIITMHLRDPIPSLLDKRPELPQEVDGILKRGMAKNRDDRYIKASDLANDLKYILQGWMAQKKPTGFHRAYSGSSSTPTVEKAAPTPWIYALAGGVFVGLLGLGLWFNGFFESESAPVMIVPTKTQLVSKKIETSTPVATATATERPTATPTPSQTATSRPTNTPTTAPPPTATVGVVEPSIITPTVAIEEPISAATVAARFAEEENLLNFPTLFNDTLREGQESSISFNDDGQVTLKLVEGEQSPVLAYFPDAELVDGYYEVELEFLDGDRWNSWAGMMLRASNTQTYYVFEVNPGGRVRVQQKTLAGTFLDIGQGERSVTNFNSGSGSNVKNVLGIEVLNNGTFFKIYINGQYANLQTRATLLKSDGVGLSANRFRRTESVEVRFSNLKYFAERPVE